jgi:pimeloyl-ACP methyl ester carboxylesterase
MKSQLVSTQKGNVEYTLVGSGPAVLICHGTSSDCYSHVLTEPLNQAGFAVVTPSRPGYGRTPLEVGKSAAQAAEAIVALLDKLSIQSCPLIAISGGGPTGLALIRMAHKGQQKRL